MIIECVNYYATTRGKHFTASSLKDVFENADAQSRRFCKRNSFLSRIIISIFS